LQEHALSTYGSFTLDDYNLNILLIAIFEIQHFGKKYFFVQTL